MLSLKVIASAGEQEQAFAIRRAVFVVEQDVDPAEEYDEFEGTAQQYLALWDNIPAGTARWRITEKGVKLERFAVLKDFRGLNLGAALVRRLVEDVKILHPGAKIYLHAQVQVIPFYEKLGFQAVGDEFTEAEIRHRLMYFVGDASSAQ